MILSLDALSLLHELVQHKIDLYSAAGYVGITCLVYVKDEAVYPCLYHVENASCNVLERFKFTSDRLVIDKH